MELMMVWCRGVGYATRAWSEGKAKVGKEAGRQAHINNRKKTKELNLRDRS